MRGEREGALTALLYYSRVDGHRQRTATFRTLALGAASLCQGHLGRAKGGCKSPEAAPNTDYAKASDFDFGKTFQTISYVT